MVRQVQLVHVADYADILGDGHLVVASVGFDLSQIMLSLTESPDYRTVTTSGASFAKKRASKANHFSIHYFVGDDWVQIDLDEADENFHFVQPLGRDQWLLVRGRADNENDQNATVFDMRGQPQRSFHAGDGVADVQTTENGEIWISYFDEGVFGDTELGQAGLVCLDGNGKLLVQYNSGVGPSYIVDCYAINVCSHKETWLYYYTDFPLVQLLDWRPAGIWQDMPVHGSHGFAVSDGLVLFCGSYNKRDRLFLVRLELMSVEEMDVLDRHGEPLTGFRGIGRRSTLHLFAAEALYRLDLNDL
jgi:hypothetical protein